MKINNFFKNVLNQILIPIIVTLIALWTYDYIFYEDPGCISGKDNCNNDYGVYRYKNGDMYKGYFRNGKPDGEGILYLSNGEKIKGLFKDGKLPTNELN